MTPIVIRERRSLLISVDEQTVSHQVASSKVDDGGWYIRECALLCLSTRMQNANSYNAIRKLVIHRHSTSRGFTSLPS